MDEKPDQILGHIEAQRSELGRNLNELETRVRQGTNWRTYFDRNPMMMLGVALGGGLLLGSAVGRRKHRHSYSSGASSAALGFASAGTMASSRSSSPRSSSSRFSSPAMAAQRHQISETMEHMKAALVGFGIAKAKEFMCQAIPGFDQHLNDAQQKHSSRSSHSSGESGSGYQQWDSDVYRSGDRENSGAFTGDRAGEPVGASTKGTL